MRYDAALTVRFEEKVLRELQAMAEEERRSTGSLVRIAVEKMLERRSIRRKFEYERRAVATNLGVD